MKKLLHILILALALTMLAAPALAEQPTATAYKATEPIVIDGNLDDWNTSSPIVINTEEQVIRDVSFWQGENDLSATVYVMWDEENLYLAADVNEDTPLWRYRNAAAGRRGQLQGVYLHRPRRRSCPHQLWHQRLPSVSDCGQ